MKNKIVACLVFLFAGLIQVLNAQTVNEIINKHIDAIGGKEKINSIKTLYSEGEIATTGGLGTTTAVSKTYIINGKGLREEIVFTSFTAKSIEGYTPNNAWRIQSKPTAELLDDAMTLAGQARLSIDGPLGNYSTNGSKVNLIGKENINGADAFHIKLITKDSIDFNYWIDPSDYYIVKRIINSKTGEHLRTDVYSDYRKTDEGIVYPFASQFKLEKSNDFYLVVNKVEINKDIDPSLFEMSK
jgi:hypothetical protein